jgi:flagellar basal body P-ring formation protein FlgA
MPTNIGHKVNNVRFFICTLLVLACVGAKAETTGDPVIKALSELANEFVKQELSTLTANGYRTEHEIGNIDPRLQRNSCEASPVFELKRPPLEGERNTLSIQCSAPAWQLFVNVTTRVFGQKIVAKGPLPKSTVIQQRHLKFTEQQVNKQRYAAYTDPQQVIGMTLRRSIRAGADFKPSYLRPADLVQRGDEVIIIAESSSISIQMKGEALDSGAYGEQIKVKNKSSERIIIAQVVDSGTVSILM